MKILLFDLDNTLYREACAGIIQAVDERIADYIARRLGMDREAAHRLRRAHWGKYGTTLTGLMEAHSIDPREYLEYIHDIDLEAALQPDPRLDAMLARIAARKMIFTNGPRHWADRVLARLGVGSRFERLFTIESMDYRAKPHPPAYSRLLAEIGREGEECVFIDDTPANLLPARALGMRTVLVHREGRHEADHHLESIYDLVDHVLRPWGVP